MLASKSFFNKFLPILHGVQVKRESRLREFAETIYSALALFVMIVAFPVFLVFLLFSVPNATQHLLLTIPIPKNASLNMAALFLDSGEVELFSRLQKLGNLKRSKKEIVIKYCGAQIYYPESNTFFIGGKEYTPTTINVKKHTEPTPTEDPFY